MEKKEGNKQTRLERCTLWSTQKFHRCYSRHITENDVIGVVKEIAVATIELDAV
jgi:hypothetical protein